MRSRVAAVTIRESAAIGQNARTVALPTEPIGSIPRPPALLDALDSHDGADPALETLYTAAIKDTIERFEATGSPVVSDGEQRKYHNFWTYCVHGLPNTAPDGFRIPCRRRPDRGRRPASTP